MKKLTSLLISLFIVLSSFSSAFGWGPDGHKAVGQIASLRIKAHTRQRISQILKPGETLAGIANWADVVKFRVGETDPDADTNAFLQDVAHNAQNANWHFDDLPLGCSGYNTCTGFTPGNDVVHIINICIRTLQGVPDPDQPLTQRNALRLLVHLVGDLHQPLHVGSGYINENGPDHTIVIVRNPSAISASTPNDQGANLLIIDGHNKNLHSFWDGDLVHLLMTTTHKQTAATLARFLKTSVTPHADWGGQGAVDTWTAQWATDSLHVSGDNAYRSVRIVSKRTVTTTHNGTTQTKTVYDIRRAANYNVSNIPVVRTQLAKGGFRLAKLLDAIFVN
ncbi:MAG: hypothetical protein QOH96_3122 [Blastocatellia bacterium]|jgi:hypothetical protein|nr:hypothetical protein [Blastocatellia bacterium]